MLAGQVAMGQGRYQAALDDFARAESEAELPISILYDRARALLHVGEATAAEQQLSELLARDPKHADANELLSALFRVVGRNWEIRPCFKEQVRQNIFSAANLAAIVSNENVAVNRGPPNETQLEEFLASCKSPHDNTIEQLRNARYHQVNNRPEQAIRLFRQVVEERPGLLDAQSRLGGLLIETGRWEALQRWHDNLPRDAWSYPDIWLAHGRWSEQRDDPRAAARCYWETLRLFPDHPEATYRLSQMLFELNYRAEAAEFSERASLINEIQTSIAVGWNPPSNIQLLAEKLESIGRLWESLGWSILTIKWSPTEETWAQVRAQRLRDQLSADTPLVLDTANLALKLDLSTWDLPTWSSTPLVPSREVLDLPQSSPIAFADHAEEAGISFSYHNAADPERAYIFEFAGGGVAVLDYDGDRWPDLYLTQGGDRPVPQSQQRYSDRLFRNLGNGRFEDVVEQAGLKSFGFGQGVAVGDFDDDGWPDLYVANIGKNQLYRNNGDGTFLDVTAEASLTETDWTLSTLIVDLNGDRFPELYDVNYLGGSDVFTRICRQNGRPIQCSPNQFPGVPDSVFQNLHDGTFRNVGQSAGVALPNGKGMGIVAADFDGSHRISLFVTNDTTNNYFFLNDTSNPGGELKFKEQGLLSGLALNRSGAAESCMGISIGDVTGDGRLDLFVTNFRDESNNLYVQRADLLFEDEIHSSKLEVPGYALEGWGAQFIDADQDGWMDLVVANGHLDDYPHSAGLKRMPTQLFRNLGEGKFAELSAADLGPHFQDPRLGRAVAVLDWNRDGKPDFCMTQVAQPFSLLTNLTPTCGNFLVVHLRAVQSSRDAVGAKVTVRSGDWSSSQQLVAGGGFQATNQACLQFGLADAKVVDEMEVTWPSGATQIFSNIETNSEIVVVEGRSPLFLRRES
ncbi:MAG: VCBS repeat-containing protein [Planctomycetaceae bacterium]|nr:VCBS repeat-containing protein [Planctomycetaceae bacterium]